MERIETEVDTAQTIFAQIEEAKPGQFAVDINFGLHGRAGRQIKIEKEFLRIGCHTETDLGMVPEDGVGSFGMLKRAEFQGQIRGLSQHPPLTAGSNEIGDGNP